MSTVAELPPLDVSIVTFNSARWIARFLDSLLRQAYPPGRINLLLRDNGSDPAEFEQCRREIEGRRAALRSIRIDRGENRGFGFGHNRNFEQGRAAFFLVTNVDLEFTAGAIVTAVQALAGDDAHVACREFRQQPYEHPKHYHPATLETEWCSSACVLFRREPFAAVGGYEERIFLYGEDVELSYRLRDRGYALKYCPAAVCVHHSYAQPGETKPEQFFGSREANFYMRLRYGSPWQIAVGLALQASLWLRAPRYPLYYRRLAAAVAQMARNATHFLRTRRRGLARFPFRLWNYEMHREGAFYRAPSAARAEAPLVSIIVRTHAGRLGWLREALASLAHQTHRRLELVVIEDGSRLAEAEADAARCGGRFANVVYRALAKGGRCRAGNAGLKAARGELIGFLDDDDLLYADHVETLAVELAADPSCGAAYGLAFEVPTDVVAFEPFCYRERAPTLVYNQPFSRAALRRRNYLPIQSVLFRRECFESHGGFDTDLDTHEDWDLWTRYSADRDFKRVAKVTSLYRVPADPRELLRRNCLLDDYYARAVAKQRMRTAAASAQARFDVLPEPGETRLSRLLSPRAVLRLLTYVPIVRPLYLPGRRLAAWLRQRRAIRADGFAR